MYIHTTIRLRVLVFPSNFYSFTPSHTHTHTHTPNETLSTNFECLVGGAQTMPFNSTVGVWETAQPLVTRLLKREAWKTIRLTSLRTSTANEKGRFQSYFSVIERYRMYTPTYEYRVFVNTGYCSGHSVISYILRTVGYGHHDGIDRW